MSEVLELDRDTLRKLQLKELESLVYFDEFCKRNDLRYYLLGGCVIGAVRHGGFIPWDDDIDLIMPRRDYQRMLKFWKEQEGGNERFLMLTTDGEVFTGNCFATDGQGQPEGYRRASRYRYGYLPYGRLSRRKDPEISAVLARDDVLAVHNRGRAD